MLESTYSNNFVTENGIKISSKDCTKIKNLHVMEDDLDYSFTTVEIGLNLYAHYFSDARHQETTDMPF